MGTSASHPRSGRHDQAKSAQRRTASPTASTAITSQRCRRIKTVIVFLVSSTASSIPLAGCWLDMGNFPQLAHGGDKLGQRIVYVIVRGEPAEAKPDRGVGFVVTEPHGLEHMAGACLAGRTCRARRNG